MPIFDNEDDAKEYSRQEAIAQGCSGTTEYWYFWNQDASGKWHCPAIEQVSEDVPS